MVSNPCSPVYRFCNHNRDTKVFERAHFFPSWFCWEIILNWSAITGFWNDRCCVSWRCLLMVFVFLYQALHEFSLCRVRERLLYPLVEFLVRIKTFGSIYFCQSFVRPLLLFNLIKTRPKQFNKCSVRNNTKRLIPYMRSDVRRWWFTPIIKTI